MSFFNSPSFAVLLDWMDDFEVVFCALLIWRIGVYELHYRDLNMQDARKINRPIACYMLFLIGVSVNMLSLWMNLSAVLAVWVLSFLWENAVRIQVPRKSKSVPTVFKRNRRHEDPKE